MTTAMAPLVLYRSLLRNAKSMKDYNFRSYALRRVKTGFIQNRSLQGEHDFANYSNPTIIFDLLKNDREEATAAITEGMKQLEILQRQAVLSQLYPSAKSVME